MRRDAGVPFHLTHQDTDMGVTTAQQVTHQTLLTKRYRRCVPQPLDNAETAEPVQHQIANMQHHERTIALQHHAALNACQ